MAAAGQDQAREGDDERQEAEALTDTQVGWPVGEDDLVVSGGDGDGLEDAVGGVDGNGAAVEAGPPSGEADLSEHQETGLAGRDRGPEQSVGLVNDMNGDGFGGGFLVDGGVDRHGLQGLCRHG